MLTWAPRVPSRKSRLRYSGSSSRDRPAGSRRSIPSKNSASVALGADRPAHRGRPGSGGTNTSGSNRVAWTCAASLTSAGRTPSAMRNTSLSKRAPSWRARTCDDDAVDAHDARPSGRTRSRATTSSSWRYRALARRRPRTRAAWRPRCRARARTGGPPGRRARRCGPRAEPTQGVRGGGASRAAGRLPATAAAQRGRSNTNRLFSRAWKVERTSRRKPAAAPTGSRSPGSKP